MKRVTFSFYDYIRRNWQHRQMQQTHAPRKGEAARRRLARPRRTPDPVVCRSPIHVRD
jgi:hypothetical protein